MATDFARALGKLEGLVEAISQKQDEEAKRSADHRARTYDAVDQIRGTVGLIDQRVKTIETAFPGLVQTEKYLHEMEYQAKGAGALGSWLLWAGAGLLGFASWAAGHLGWLSSGGK